MSLLAWLTMKLLMLLGGLIGFLIGIFFGVVQESRWPSVLWRASIAAYAAGLLMRWWGRVWVKSLHESYHERLTTARGKSAPQIRTTPTNL
jgi:hypothetical protein